MGLRMNWQRPLLHPLALGLIALSVIVAAGLALAAPWSNRYALVLAWGILGYCLVAIIRLSETRPKAPDAVVVPQAHDIDFEEIAKLAAHALRSLNNLPALGRSPLIAQLPRTLARYYEGGAPEDQVVSPSEQARCLRRVLLEAIDSLKADDSAEEPLHYQILQEEYVLGRPNTQVMTRHHIAERTFFRYRHEAVRALAAELVRRENEHLPPH